MLRAPVTSDGQRVWGLAGACPPLEQNTEYAYLLLCSHFAQTCAIAEIAGEAVGYVVAYLLPEQPGTLFVWQIGVTEQGRGRGLGKLLLREVLRRPACTRVQYLETTVSPSNIASQQLFRALAKELGVPCEEKPFFAASHFSSGAHEAEVLFRLGPMTTHKV